MSYSKLHLKIIKYLAVVKVNIQSRTAIFADMIARNLAIAFRIWMFAQIYMASFHALGQTHIGNLDLKSTIWIMMFVQIFRSSSRPRVDKLIDESVRTGAFAYTINKPYSFVLFHYFGFIGRIIPSVLTNLLVGITIAALLSGLIKISILNIIIGTILLFLGYTLNFFIEIIIGLSAFWVENTEPFSWIYQRTQYILGGAIVPISLFPEKLAPIAEFLPFSQIYYGAARVLVDLNFFIILKYFLIQSFWIIFFSFLAFIIFRKGIKNVSINGG
ncbi:MAG: hypothetical protein WC436_03530 [Candidatus Babeliales bacterium]